MTPATLTTASRAQPVGRWRCAIWLARSKEGSIMSAHRSPLVERPVALDAFRGLFCALYGVRDPVLPLRNVLHWFDGVRRFGSADHELHTVPTAVMGGSFYNISTPAPSQATLEAWLAEAESIGVEQVLVPTVRRERPTGALANSGFVAVPWFVEAEFTITDGLDADLRAR